MRKKIYIQPEVEALNVNLSSALMETTDVPVEPSDPNNPEPVGAKEASWYSLDEGDGALWDE